MKLKKLLLNLDKHYGWLGWWPVTPKNKINPVYSKNKNLKLSNKQKFEIAVGAVLTQNTTWKNAESAIIKLNKKNLVSPKKIFNTNKDIIIECIKSSGYFNQKYKKLKFLSQFFIDNSFSKLNKKSVSELRQELLNIWGIGPETADSIILYAFNKPIFVIDAYTKRILIRNKIITKKHKYDEIQELIQNNIPVNINLYKNIHASIVELCKNFCKPKPLCEKCILN